jgi:hypothetical protein
MFDFLAPSYSPNRMRSRLTQTTSSTFQFQLLIDQADRQKVAPRCDEPQCHFSGHCSKFTRRNTMPSTSQRPKILLLGDSLTQISFDGWGGGLAHRYQRRADVLNRGMSGYNTRWYLQYGKDSEVWKEPGNVALATIWFGANDASLATENPHHHVP